MLRDRYEMQEDWHILLVEDEKVVRNLIHAVLRQNGYRVLVAHNGAVALQLSEEHAEPIHLIVTDVVMPQMNGPEMVKRLEAVRPGVEVLYISGYADIATVDIKALTQRGNFLQKPFDPDILVGKVREILDA